MDWQSTTLQRKMPDEEYIDFTHPKYVPTLTPRGVQYPILMTPQGAAKILNKAARKHMIGAKVMKGKTTAKSGPAKK